MAKVENLEKLVATLRAKAAAARQDSDVSVVVGYTQAYALFVHENMQGRPNPPRSDAQRRAMFAKIRENEQRGHVPWKVGQPKFLEQPARELQGELARIVRTALKQGKTLAQGLLLAGLRLQRESMRLVPIDTGALRASAFTRLE